MKKALSILLAAALLAGLLALPVSAEQVVVNSVTSREELKTRSTLYVGEVVRDGRTVLRYLWSADLTVMDSSRSYLSEALAAAEHTGYDALLTACTDAQTGPVKGIAVCEDPAWTAKMDAG